MFLEKNINGTINQIRLDNYSAQNDYSYMIAYDIVNSLNQESFQATVSFDICVKCLTSEMNEDLNDR